MYLISSTYIFMFYFLMQQNMFYLNSQIANNIFCRLVEGIFLLVPILSLKYHSASY